MKERPIIFSGPMVRAILDGRKTQTRRVIKPQPIAPLSQLVDTPDLWTFTCCDMEWRCPYGQSGDLLWVRETWKAEDNSANALEPIGEGNPPTLLYWADGELLGVKWKSSRFMPKEYARLWLRVTNVRVERVQEISEEDIRAEGVYLPEVGIDGFGKAFAHLWNSLNAKRSYSWESDPRVWVVEFERYERTYD